MGITLEKILNIDIKDYVQSGGKTLTDYQLIGVHSHEPTVKEFAQIVPNNCEVVVNYQHRFFITGEYKTTARHHQSGVGLVPK